MTSRDTAAQHSVEDRSPSSFSQKVTNIFSIPAPVKSLFDLVPVVTYAPNAPPQRGLNPSKVPTLYVFTTDADAAAGRPSFNPRCLKWQVS